jgi:hypothetical protein
VDLLANNKSLRAAFSNWLTEQRRLAVSPKSKERVDLETLINWRDNRLLLFFDAMLWCQTIKPNVVEGADLALELAMLVKQDGKWGPGADNKGDKAASLRKGVADHFNLERALALLGMANAGIL